MSYLSMPRLTFSGHFQCDVSTVNNDVRHFDNTTFEERFHWQSSKDWLGNPVENGWWNPGGTGAFRFVDVAVVRAQMAIDAIDAAAADDKAVGLGLVSQTGRTAAKLVDLDPQWQNASMIFGLAVALTDGATTYARALYQAAPFRDLYFMRVQGLGGDAGASAKFTSVLTDIEWADEADDSPVLAALKASAARNDGKLAINLMTYGFSGDASSQGFTFGRMVGTIAPWQRGEPDSFVAGRRFAPAGGFKYLSADPAQDEEDRAKDQAEDPEGIDPLVHPPLFATPQGIGFFDAEVAPDGRSVSVDLSNALPLENVDGTMFDLGPLALMLLKPEDRLSSGRLEPGIKQGDAATGSEVVDIGEVPYREPGWLAQTAGILDLPLSGDAAALIRERPLALVGGRADRRVMIRETVGGYFVRADDFEKRIDTLGDQQAVKTEVTLYARRFGAPLAGHPIAFELSKPMAEQGGGSASAADQPKAQAPIIGTPTSQIRFCPAAKTDGDGRVTMPIYAFDPGNPRRYLDGQVYLVEYTLGGLHGLSAMPVFEQIVIHARQAFLPSANPPDFDWDLRPILTQYENLYPVMGRGLFALSDPEVLQRHAQLLYLSFSLDIDDPNQMPATRDLSAGKRRALLLWLSQFLQPAPPMPKSAELPQPVPSSEPIPGPAPVEPSTDPIACPPRIDIGQETGGKAAAAALYIKARSIQSA